MKKGCLCNINVWRRKSGNSMEGFYSPLSCISRSFRPECSFDRKESRIPVYRLPILPSRSPGAGEAKRILQIRKKHNNQSQKHGYHPLQHEPAFPDDKSRVDAEFSCDLAVPPDSERPAILTGMDTIRVFVLSLSTQKSSPSWSCFFHCKNS